MMEDDLDRADDKLHEKYDNGQMPYGQVNRLVAKLAHYHFEDVEGHPLETCEDYMELISIADKLAQVELDRDRLQTIVTNLTCDNLKTPEQKMYEQLKRIADLLDLLLHQK